jgi:mannan endo-1,4-beta-mannosidase
METLSSTLRKSFSLLAAVNIITTLFSPANSQEQPQRHYHIGGPNIICNGEPTILRGINAMHIFSPKDPSIDQWDGIKIIREFVGDLQHAPLERGETWRDPNHNWTLNSLQTLIDKNRERGVLTILCPFTWNGEKSTQFTGCNPLKQEWYPRYKQRMQEWARHFKGQSDLWIELMNEPFHELESPQDSQMWLDTMSDMVDNLRTAGWEGVIVVPGSGWGQDETVIERMGHKLERGRRNLIFDVHVYTRWLKDPKTIGERLDKIKQTRLAYIFGEIGPGSPSEICDTSPFLNQAKQRGLNVLAWGWGTNGPRTVMNLQNNDGSPNNNGNYSWGWEFKKFLKTP